MISLPTKKKPAATSWLRWMQRRWTAIRHPSTWLWFCGCCGRTYYRCEHHTTSDEKSGSGIFVLCRECWSEMTPDERLPYYDSVFAEWRKDGWWDSSDYNREEDYVAHIDRLRSSVMAGG